MSVRKRLGTAAASVLPLRASASRMRPGYLIIGTKRGGTTSLAEWIERHPQVAPSRSNKGTHYFDINYRRGPQWYFSRFEKRIDGVSITGEASPYYMYHPAAPDRIAATLPDAKLICLLRDPVERAWSHHRYEVSRGHESEPFEKALELEPRRTQGERERLLADPTYDGFAYRHHGYLARGHYADQLTAFYDKFPREQILLLSSEGLFRDPEAQLRRVWSFLDVEALNVPALRAHNANVDTSVLSPATASRVKDYYRPHNERLLDLTGIDFGWSREPRQD